MSELVIATPPALLIVPLIEPAWSAWALPVIAASATTIVAIHAHDRQRRAPDGRTS
jgi:hypothetical protein